MLKIYAIGEQGEEGNVLGEDGGNGLARAAPCRKGIDDDLGMILEDLVELGLAVVGGRNTRATVSSLDDFPAGQYPLVVEKKTYLATLWTPILIEFVLKAALEAMKPMLFCAMVVVIRGINVGDRRAIRETELRNMLREEEEEEETRFHLSNRREGSQYIQFWARQDGKGAQKRGRKRQARKAAVYFPVYDGIVSRWAIWKELFAQSRGKKRVVLRTPHNSSVP